MPRRLRSSEYIPLEILHMAAQNLQDSPRKLLMLCCVSKTLKFTEEEWERFWHQHRIYWKSKKKRPHFYLDYEPPSSLITTVFKIVYGLFCSHCGCRYHHTLFETYRIRLCKTCLRCCHISNNVLWYKYGISLQELMPYRFFIRNTSMKVYFRSEALIHLSNDSLDLVYNEKRSHIFFWLPDLKRFFDLDSKRKEHIERLAAINTLKGYFKTLFARSCKLRHLVETLQTNENARICRPITKHGALNGTNMNLAFLTKKNGRTRAMHSDLFIAFKFVPMPLTNNNQFCLRTMGERLNLQKKEILELAGRLCNNDFSRFASHRFDKSSI